MATEMLVDVDVYLKTGAHIGTRYKSGEMRKYIYKLRKDGLKVLNVTTIDERIRAAAKFLAGFEGGRIAVVSRKLYGQTAVEQFADAVGARRFTGRFVPGTFTNPTSKIFFEPAVVLVTESDSDIQAVEEATKAGVPVVGICSTNNTTKNVDIVIPVNNKGRKSLALVYWLLAREILKGRGEIKEDADFKKTMEDFEYKMAAEGSEEEEFARPRPRFRKRPDAKGRRRTGRR